MGSIIVEIVPIIAIFVFGSVIVNIIKASKSGKLPKASQEKLVALEEDFMDMERSLNDALQRIEVLERIVTDEKSELSRKINGLSS